MKTLLTAAVLCLVAVPVSAQTSNPIPANSPFRLVADKRPATENVTAYRCYVGATLATLAQFAQVPSPPTGTTVECQHPGLMPGTFVAAMTAVNVFGESMRSTIDAAAGTPPGPPQNFQIIGTITITGSIAPVP